MEKKAWTSLSASGDGVKPGNGFRSKALFIIACFCGIVVVVISIWLAALNAIPIGDGNPPNFTRKGELKDDVPVYRFAIHPLHNPQRLFLNFQPLVDMINKNVSDFKIVLVAGRDYGSFEKRLLAEEFDFALANPLQALASLQKGYRLVGKMGDDAHFCGLIIARTDSGITDVTQLAGSEISYPSPTALAATLMPRLFLKQKGLDLAQVNEFYSGSQESAIMNAYVGNSAVACTWPMPWNLLLEERPELAKDLQVLWKTESLVNNAIVARDNVPDAHIKQIMAILKALPESGEGRDVLKRLSLSAFEDVNESEYVDKVMRFLDSYKTEFNHSGKDIMPNLLQ